MIPAISPAGFRSGRTKNRPQDLPGPPAGDSIAREQWENWHRHGFVVCPRCKTTCTSPACGMGASCLEMRAIGLAGDGAPLKRKDRPYWGHRRIRSKSHAKGRP